MEHEIRFRGLLKKLRVRKVEKPGPVGGSLEIFPQEQ